MIYRVEGSVKLKGPDGLWSGNWNWSWIVRGQSMSEVEQKLVDLYKADEPVKDLHVFTIRIVPEILDVVI